MILIPVLEGVNTIFARVSIILNLEKPFFAMLRRSFEGVLEVLGFFTGGLKVFFNY
jgi:hypothetical protein